MYLIGYANSTEYYKGLDPGLFKMAIQYFLGAGGGGGGGGRLGCRFDKSTIFNVKWSIKIRQNTAFFKCRHSEDRHKQTV